MLENPVILIVDNEAIIRMETVQIVKDAGYTALDVPNTNEVITILEERLDIRAVFTEIRVPGHMDGMELARAVAQRWPLIRLIVTSGAAKLDNFPPDWRYISKPYEAAQITAVLRELVVPHLRVLR